MLFKQTYWGFQHQPVTLGPIIFDKSTQSGTGQLNHTLNGLPACRLILTIASGTSGNNAAITDNATLTWVDIGDASAGGSGDAEIYWADYGGGNLTVQAQLALSENSSVLYAITNQETTFGTTGVTATNQNIPSLGITTTRANSLIIGVIGDFNAISAGGTRSYLDGAIEDFYYNNPVDHTGYFFHKVATTIQTYTEGVTAPSGQSSGISLLEVRTN